MVIYSVPIRNLLVPERKVYLIAIVCRVEWHATGVALIKSEDMIILIDVFATLYALVRADVAIGDDAVRYDTPLLFDGNAYFLPRKCEISNGTAADKKSNI